MKQEIHPDYQQVLFHDTNADTYFLIGSTLKPSQSKEYQGQVYPYVTLDISSASATFEAKSPWLRSLVRVRILLLFQSDGRTPCCLRD